MNEIEEEIALEIPPEDITDDEYEEIAEAVVDEPLLEIDLAEVFLDDIYEEIVDDQLDEIAEEPQIEPDETEFITEEPQIEPDVEPQIETQIAQPAPVQEPQSIPQEPPLMPPVITQPLIPVPIPVPSPPVQPPVLPPTALGPAEERESAPAQIDPWDDSELFTSIGEEPFTPFQPVIIPEADEIIFSRVVRATVGQIIEIPFRGNGWVYLGELASRRGIVYDSRRLDPDGQSFIFRVEQAGTYALKFFRQDFIRDYIINDHVQVIVGEAPAAGGAGWFNPPIDRGRIVAEPRWPSPLEEAEIFRASRPEASTPEREPAIDIPQEASSVQETASVMGIASLPSAAIDRENVPLAADTVDETPQIILPDDLLQRAKESFENGNIAAAITLLDQYRDFFPSGTDELFWLYGQLYEANSPSRNILLSLEYYRRLINEYPQSSRFNDARRRVAYLERFFINIR